MKWLIRLWSFIKELSGDDAYERYLEHQAKAHLGSILLSRKEFFKMETERKWEGIRRCC